MSAMTGAIIPATLAEAEFTPSIEFLSDDGYISADQKYINSKPADTANLPIMLTSTIDQS